MPSMNSTLSTSNHNIDNIEKFLTAYINASPREKERLFTDLNPEWMSSITTIQFGQLISHMQYHRAITCYQLITKLNPSFLNNAEEFTQICAHLAPEKIPFFCELIKQRLHTPNFIDNATAFSAIFSVFSFSPPNGEEQKIQLNTQQLLAVYNILEPKLSTPSFFRTLNDFANLFPLIPTAEDKTKIFKMFHEQFPRSIEANCDVNYIHEKLKPSNTNESELFKRARETVFRMIINSPHLNKAFHAMLFLVLDNYPGKQPEKLKSIIEATFSDPTITELNKLLEKTESAMRFIEFNITSTRLQNALTHLIANLRSEEKIINVDHIIQLAKSKDPIVDPSFFKKYGEKQITTAAETFTAQHEF